MRLTYPADLHRYEGPGRWQKVTVHSPGELAFEFYVRVVDLPAERQKWGQVVTQQPALIAEPVRYE